MGRRRVECISSSPSRPGARKFCVVGSDQPNDWRGVLRCLAWPRFRSHLLGLQLQSSRSTRGTVLPRIWLVRSFELVRRPLRGSP